MDIMNIKRINLFFIFCLLMAPLQAQVVLETDSIKSNYYDIEEEEEDDE